jgi:hypothetical protein
LGSLFRNKATVFLAVLLLLLIPAMGVAGQTEITDVIVTNTRDDVLLYFNVQNIFTQEVEKAILNGVLTQLTFFISLYRVRNFWFDEKLAVLELHHTIKYDNVKNEFTVTRNEHNQPVVVKSFVEAEKIMATVDDLAVIPLTRLSTGGRYQVRLKAELDEGPLPFYLHYILFFISWNIETDWYTADFIY